MCGFAVASAGDQTHKTKLLGEGGMEKLHRVCQSVDYVKR